MPRTKTKARPKRRRPCMDDPTPMSYQGWTSTEICDQLDSSVTDPSSLSAVVLFTKICVLLKLERIEQVTRDHDARAVLAFAAFTGPEAGADGEWEEIYRRIDDYIEVCRSDEKRIHPMVNELRNLIVVWMRQRKIEAARKAKGGAS